MSRSILLTSLLTAATTLVIISPVAAFGFSFHSGAFGAAQSPNLATDITRIISVYEGDRTALQLTTVPEMKSSVFKDSDADNGRLNHQANSVAGLPERLFKLTDPERIARLEQLAGHPLTFRKLRKAFAESVDNNPVQAISTGASSLFLARKLHASPRDMVNLMRTGVLILASKGTQFLPQASALVGFAVQVSGPEAHQTIVSSLRYSMIGALPENLSGGSISAGNDYKSQVPTSQNSAPDLEWENFPGAHSADVALVGAGILKAVGMSDAMWDDVSAMKSQYRMGNELLLAARGPDAWFDNFDIMGVGSGPFGIYQNPYIPELPSLESPDAEPAPTPLVFPTPPPPYS